MTNLSNEAHFTPIRPLVSSSNRVSILPNAALPLLTQFQNRERTLWYVLHDGITQSYLIHLALVVVQGQKLYVEFLKRNHLLIIV